MCYVCICVRMLPTVCTYINRTRWPPMSRYFPDTTGFPDCQRRRGVSAPAARDAGRPFCILISYKRHHGHGERESFYRERDDDNTLFDDGCWHCHFIVDCVARTHHHRLLNINI